MPPPVYRYDAADLKAGEIVTSRGDHIHRLTGQQRKAEEAIREVSPEWARIRSQSLYVWRDLETAERLWRLTQGQEHLYELTVDMNDFEHMGDLTYFNMIEETVGGTELAHGYALRQYFKQRIARPAVEMLFKKATVVRKLFDVSQK